MADQKRTILLIEDDDLTAMLVARLFPEEYEICRAKKLSEVEKVILNKKIYLSLVDLDLEYVLEGLDILKVLRKKDIPALILSARNDKKVIKEAFEIGALEYLQKPLSEQLLKQILITRELKTSRAQKFNEDLDSHLVNAVISSSPVMIHGESGVGKTRLVSELFDLWRKAHPDNKDKKLIQINCSEFSETLLESEFFGHVKGAFTGANKDKKGILELADQGILFLDEIGTISLSLQKKLLKAIEEQCFYPVGSEKALQVSFKLVSATCENLEDKVTAGLLREDFYHRISGLKIKIKPLRERKDEIPQLIENFISTNRRSIIFEDDALDLLVNYQWPGNIRELNHVLERLYLLDVRLVTVQELKPLLKIDDQLKELKEILNDDDFISRHGLVSYIERVEKQVVEQYLNKNMGKIRKTIEDLRISPSVFYRIKGE